MQLWLRVLGVLLRIANVLVLPLIKFVGGPRRKTPFPEIRNEMLEMPAVDLAERIRNKEVSRLEWMEALGRLWEFRMRIKSDRSRNFRSIV